MVLTPSSTSSGLAGFTFWGMIWLTICELDAVAKLLCVNSFVSSRAVLRWVLNNKSVSLICTELVNYGIHGVTNSIAVTFAIGGTTCNALMIFIVLPIVDKVRGPRWLYGGIK